MLVSSLTSEDAFSKVHTLPVAYPSLLTCSYSTLLNPTRNPHPGFKTYDCLWSNGYIESTRLLFPPQRRLFTTPGSTRKFTLAQYDMHWPLQVYNSARKNHDSQNKRVDVLGVQDGHVQGNRQIWLRFGMYSFAVLGFL